MVQKVKVKESHFTKEDIKEVDRVRQGYQVIDWPSNTTFKSIIKKKLIRDIHINIY